MLYIITILFILINILMRDSKYLFVVDFVFLFILLGLSDGSYDTLIFFNRYIDPERYSDFTEILFNGIIKFFHLLNFNYRQFMMAVSFIELIMLFVFIKKHTKNVCFVIGVFMIFPMLHSFEQLRFLMGFIIVLTVGIDSLLKSKKNHTIIYCISVLIATLIHSSCIFFMLFILAKKFNTKTIIKITIFTTIILSTIGIRPEMLKIIGFIIGDSKLEIVTRIQKGQEGQFGCSCLSTLVFLEYLVYYLYINNKTDKLGINKSDLDNINLVLKFNIISIIAIPLIYIFSTAFMRIAVFLLILNYVFISKSLDYDKKYCTTKYKFIITISTTMCAVVLFFFASHTKIAFDLNVRPFFEENIILTIFDNNYEVIYENSKAYFI